MANIQVNITQNGTTVLDASGKYCDRNIDVNVNVPSSDELLEETRRQLLAVQAELEAKEAELTAKEAELAEQQAIEDSLLQRTLTTYYNNRTIYDIPQYLFLQATSLESVHCTNLTSQVSYAAFKGCKKLQEAIFERIRYGINGSVFDGCSALTVLVVGTSTVIKLISANAFNGTPIASGTGYVYVQDSLVDSYKVATNWSTYASQIKPISELRTTHPEIYAKLEL